MGTDRQADSPSVPGPVAGVPLGSIPLHSTNLISVIEDNGIIRYQSPAIERVFGFDPDGPVGTHITEYFHPDDREMVLEAFQSIVDAEEYIVQAVEYRHKQGDGSYRWVESIASADPIPDGFYVVNTRDITGRKEREQRLERSNERLDKFARVVSHDLRNPLSVAIGRLQLAREECDNEHLVAVERAHERMEELIDDLLTLALGGERIEEMELVDVAALSESCWQSIATAEATLATETNRSISADRSRLRQLFENLLGNAVKHGGDGVTITIGALAGDEGFYVADDGPGIPEESHDRVFESGYSTRVDGTGLGLGITAEIAGAHGWEINLTESKGGGARFEFLGAHLH